MPDSSSVSRVDSVTSKEELSEISEDTSSSFASKVNPHPATGGTPEHPATGASSQPQRRPSGGVPSALLGSIGPHGVTGIIVGPGSQVAAQQAPVSVSKSPQLGAGMTPQQMQQYHQQQQQRFHQLQQQQYQQHGAPSPASKDFLSNMGLEFNDFAHQTSSLFSDIFGELMETICFLSCRSLDNRLTRHQYHLIHCPY